MHWLFGGRRLQKLGILGMNRRNAACILDRNPRSKYPLVDDKLRMRNLCMRIDVPTPEIHGVVTAYGELRQLPRILGDRTDFVIKPSHGSAGRGILVILGRAGDRFLRHNGDTLQFDQVRQHISDILSGMYSLGGRPDYALIQQRVLLHPDFQRISYKGIPDIRVVVYRNEPAMAMLRLPTKASNGRANLHQGGIGTGVDLDTGRTNHAVQSNRLVHRHPDTGVPLLGIEVPFWDQVLDMARGVAKAVDLGYVGVDIVVDAKQGPMLLEANARPGLAIQIANAKGLLPRLAEIDAMLEQGANRIEADRVVIGRIGQVLRKSA
ncbi:MAG: alpha-L-glutamate ligase-like protein [Gemmataceae bacterium]|nr:alpha-L-glutamate ligase-like protein [Gemmataceae bacterium]